MALAKFSIIVSVDSEWGMSKQNSVPWSDNTEISNFFRTTTIGNRRNAIIMGATTFKYIGSKGLQDRKTFVISSTLAQTDYNGISIYSSLKDVLHNIGDTRSMYDDVYIMGGSAVIEEALGRYSYLCKKIILTRLKLGHRCDKFFPKDILHANGVTTGKKDSTNTYDRLYFDLELKHPEEQFIGLIRTVLSQPGYQKTGVKTPMKKIFGEKECYLKFDISETVPIFTTRKLDYQERINELLTFIKGKTNSEEIDGKNKEGYWRGKTTTEVLQEKNLNYEEGDMGPMYGFQWRHYGAEYKSCQDSYIGQGFDQLGNLVDLIKTDPWGGRLVLSAWNVKDLDKMVHPPKHPFVHFEVIGDTKLDALVYLKDVDVAIELPNAIALYAMLVHVLSQLASLKPNFLKVMIGNAHLHHPNEENMEKLVKRVPLPFTKLVFKRKHELKSIDDFTISHFEIQNYESWDRMTLKLVI